MIFNWALWLSLRMFYFYPNENNWGMYISNIFVYISAATIIQCLVYFALSFHNPRRNFREYAFLMYPYFLIIACILVPYVGILNISWINSVNYRSIPYFMFMVYILTYIYIYIHLLVDRYKQLDNPIQKRHIQIIFFGTVVSLAGALISNMILPFLSQSERVSYYGPIFSIFLSFAVIFAMLRYRLFRIKLPIAGLLTTLVITVFVLVVRFVFVDNNFTQGRRSSLLVVFMFTALYSFLTREAYVGAQKQIILDKKKKELEIALNSKNDFLKIASHQLRTPLTVIKGYLSMITTKEDPKYELNENTLNDLQKVYISAKNLNEIINDVLAANDVNTGRFGINIKDTMNLKDLIDLIVLDKQQLLKDKSTKVTVKCLGKDFRAFVDRAKLKEAINNIFDNAIYYGKGKVNITIDARDNKDFYIHIQDNGVGITRDDSQKIWKKFERGKKSSMINPNGSGLGLYLAKKIMEKHGGDIEVYSEGRDKGSKFSFRLPRNTREYAPADSFGVNIPELV
jgi:signal transduction histidine kinase